MVLLAPVKFWRVEEPVVERLEKLPVPEVVKLVAVRLVKAAVVEKRFVVVAAVPVALLNVKSWNVEEPVTRRLPPNLVLPTTSRILPVVVVAVVPNRTTSDVSFSTIARLSVEVPKGLVPVPPPEVRSVPHVGSPPDTLRTVPAPPIGSFESVVELLAYRISPVV